MYYTGKLTKNGRKFDECNSGKPFEFRLGAGEVIKGWDLGVKGMSFVFTGDGACMCKNVF